MIISDGINHGKLQNIIVGELKKAGLKHRLKKIILKSVKDNKTVFGAPLVKVPSCSVICCGSTLNIPIVVNEMSALLRVNAHIEGIFRKAGSQSRQKDIKRLLDSGGCVSEGHHPIDVASVLKLYLRTLPEPLISAEVQDLLLRCRLTAGEDALESILHTLLLLPVLHVHLLHYVMELLNYIASRHSENLMDSSNLAIVMAPSIMPLPVAATAQRLEHHVALVKIFIENSNHIGILSDELMSQLDDDSEVYLGRRKKRRSGSLNRVFHGLRKMVSGSVNTPATVRECGRTPILSKSAAKRKYDTHDGLSAKTRKNIKQNLPHKELSFTPMKMGLAEKKRLRMSLLDAKGTPHIHRDYKIPVNCETSSDDVLTSSEHLFSAHDTIDLSPDLKPEKDYVRITKKEYEEIKNRVSAIENRLSREFTDVTNTESAQQVQDVYEQTLEDVAMLNCPTSDHLARRLSKELKIRPTEENKIIRSPSARKIGSIRRRSKENVTNIVRHKSWNASTLSQAAHVGGERFYPYVNLRNRRSEVDNKKSPTKNAKYHFLGSDSENSLNNSVTSRKSLRKRISNAFDYKSAQQRRSLNTAMTWDKSESSVNSSFNCSKADADTSPALTGYVGRQKSPQQKWRSAAAFFMTKAGELDANTQSGRPSVNKLRRQNAGAVLAKAKMFESSSDKSSERNTDKTQHAGFARKPRLSGPVHSKNNYKNLGAVKSKMYANTEHKDVKQSEVPPALPARTYKQNIKPYSSKDTVDWKSNKLLEPPSARTPLGPALKRPLVPQRTVRTPAIASDPRKPNTPMKGVHTSPRRRSPRHKYRNTPIN